MRNILDTLFEYIINLFNSSYKSFRAIYIVKLRIVNTKLKKLTI